MVTLSSVLVKLMQITHTKPIDAEGFLGLLSDEGTMREDLQSHDHELLERMRAALQREAAGTVVVVGQSQLGRQRRTCGCSTMQSRPPAAAAERDEPSA